MRAGRPGTAVRVVRQVAWASGGTPRDLLHHRRTGSGHVGLPSVVAARTQLAQVVQELTGPVVDVVIEHVPPHDPHPPRLVPGGVLGRRHHGGLQPVDVVRVDQVGLPQLLRGPGELAQHQRAVVAVPAGHVLLGHQVHPVAQRGDDHDVGRPVHGGHLLPRVGVVQVDDRRPAEPAGVAVDPADEPVDVVAEQPVLLDPLPRRGGDLQEHRVLGIDGAVGHQLAEGADPLRQSLGVVESVDAQEDRLRVTEIGPDLPGPLGRRVGHGQVVHARGVDGDRVRPGDHRPTVGGADPVPAGLVGEPLPHQPDEVLGAAGQLEADQVRAEQSLQDLAAPGQLLEQLGGRERDVQEEADPQVGSQLAQHLRHQLQLVVLDPHLTALVGDPGRRLGEALVDGHVAVPPLAVVGRGSDDVVVERPQRAVREALVVELDVLGRQVDRLELQVVVGERLDVVVGRAGPADPGAAVGAHHRLEGGHQTAGGGAPLHRSVGVLEPVDRQPVGHHDEGGLLRRPSSRRAHRRFTPNRSVLVSRIPVTLARFAGRHLSGPEGTSAWADRRRSGRLRAMSSTGPVSDAGIDAMRAVMDRPEQTMLALDFDGTLAPIIDDPEHAHADPTAVAALSRLGSMLGAVVVITGRPARTAVRLGGFREAAGSAVDDGARSVRGGALGRRRRPVRPAADPRRASPTCSRSCPGCWPSSGSTACGSRTRAGRSASTPVSWPTRAPPSTSWASRCASWPAGTT